MHRDVMLGDCLSRIPNYINNVKILFGNAQVNDAAMHQMVNGVAIGNQFVIVSSLTHL